MCTAIVNGTLKGVLVLDRLNEMGRFELKKPLSGPHTMIYNLSPLDVPLVDG